MLPTLSILAVVVAIVGHHIAPASADAATDANDVKVLQYALTLEHLEAEFYTFGQQTFSSAQFTAANFPSGTWDYFNVIKNHEVAHVAFLNNVLGSAAATACQYDFTSVTDVNSYVTTAIALESTGVMAYDGAINGITATAYQQAAATIATIEARHTAYVRNLKVTSSTAAESPFPSVLDSAATPSAVFATASKFIKNGTCKYDLGANLPTVRPNGVATDTTYAAYFKTSPTQSATALYSQAQFDNDLLALNYALTLEQLEAAFYMAAVQQFNSTQWSAYNSNGAQYLAYLQLISSHETSHVQTLTDTIKARGGTPQAACRYNFASALVDIPTLLRTASVLENTGVAAYDGAVNTIVDTGLQKVAATIATVEGRHAAWLNGVIGLNATTDTTVTPTVERVTDNPIQPAAVLAAVGKTNFIVPNSCTLPTVPTVVAFVAVNQAPSAAVVSWVSAALLVASIALSLRA